MMKYLGPTYVVPVVGYAACLVLFYFESLWGILPGAFATGILINRVSG